MSNEGTLSKEKKEIPETEYREKLSTWVSLASVIGIIVLAGLVIVASWVKGDSNAMIMVFTSVLPLFGAWIGTILAFYYGRENFEAATRSVTKIALAVGPMEKLKEIPVKSKMIARIDMTVDDRPIEEIKLTEILEKLGKWQRLPILNKKGAIVCMVHRSTVDRYLANKALLPTPPDLKNLTLKNLLDDDRELKEMLEKGFGTVEEDATLAKVKIVMENIPSCQDVFVTKSGSKDEPVIGWITNVIIQEVSKV